MIEKYRFGSMTILGKDYHNDLKILKSQVLSNWWRGEGHSVEAADVDDIVSEGPEVLVVGMGQPGRMHVEQSLRAALAESGIELIEEPTSQAIQSFNRLHKEGRDVAGAFHLTC